jgi:hypothetical protein
MLFFQVLDAGGIYILAFLQEGTMIARLVGNFTDDGYSLRVRQLFDQIDGDSGGSLSAEEMVQYLKTCGMRSITTKKLAPLMRHMGLQVWGSRLERVTINHADDEW